MPVDVPIPGMEWIGATAALASAIFAGIAVIFTLIIHRDTRRLFKRTERPIISPDRPKCKIGLLSGGFQIRVDLRFPFKNIGKNPAQDVRMRMGVCPKQAPQLFKNYADTSMANRIDPEGVFIWETHMEYPTILGKELQSAKIHFLFYILVTYNDIFDPSIEYHDEFYLEYAPGESTAGHARMEDRLALEPYVKKVYSKTQATNSLFRLNKKRINKPK